MLVTTTSTLEGRRIARYYGIVSGETIIGANVFRDFMASIRDFVGGRSNSYEEVLREARETALREMEADGDRHRHCRAGGGLTRCRCHVEKERLRPFCGSQPFALQNNLLPFGYFAATFMVRVLWLSLMRTIQIPCPKGRLTSLSASKFCAIWPSMP